NDPNRVNVAISRAKKLLVIVGDSKTVIGGAPELFGPLFEHAKQEGLVAGVGAVVTACQRVGIRSQVQRLSRPHRGERRARRRRRGQRTGDVATNGEALTGEHSDLEPAIIDGDGQLTSNGDFETTVPTSSVEADLAPRVTTPLDPPTETDPPL
ncbi:MAG TPA: hypothetical protein VNG70_08270, partial [Candidatus Limnocylindria bacterium]|nr:hypothetical protein [Candidatus Limnocylindria bacterium]